MTKAKKPTKDQQKIDELTADLQRLRADFENYRKRSDEDKTRVRQSAAQSTTAQLLPLIDTIARASQHVPSDLADHPWVKGFGALSKQLDKTMSELKIVQITAAEGTPFNPELHQAVSMDDEAEGEHEVIDSELQAGYTYDGQVLRPAMVRVTRR